jgi:hypothetical protein
MGTYLADANADNLLAGSTLNAAGTTTGTIVQVNWPGDVKLVLTTSTVTGSTPTLNILIEGDETADFSGTTTRSYGRFGAVAAESNATHEMNAYIDSKYVRATVIAGGTSPVYTGSTLKMQPKFYQHDKTNSAGALV